MFSFSSWEIVTRTVKSKRKQFEYKKELPDRWVAELSKSLVVFQIKTRRATTTTTTLCVDVFAYTRGRFYLVSPAGLFFFFFSFYVGEEENNRKIFIFTPGGSLSLSLSLFFWLYRCNHLFCLLNSLLSGFSRGKGKMSIDSCIPIRLWSKHFVILYVFFVVGFSRQTKYEKEKTQTRTERELSSDVGKLIRNRA
jgi:hypothetical protein